MSVTFHVQDSETEMNLSNSNAYALLVALGQPEKAEDMCGQLEPSETLRALALLESNPSVLVTENHDNRGVSITENGVASCARVLSFGRTYEQVVSYIERLKTLSYLALGRGTFISFG